MLGSVDLRNAHVTGKPSGFRVRQGTAGLALAVYGHGIEKHKARYRGQNRQAPISLGVHGHGRQRCDRSAVWCSGPRSGWTSLEPQAVSSRGELVGVGMLRGTRKVFIMSLAG
jgi:hypothetical protein